MTERSPDLQVAPGLDAIALGARLELAEDPSGAIGVEALRADPSALAFAPTGKPAPFLGFSRSTWWLRLRLHNPSTTDLDRLLEFGFPLLDEVSLWLDDGHALRSLGRSGFQVPFAERPIAHRNSIFPVHLKAGSHIVIYGRIRSQTQISLPVVLWSEAGLRNRDQGELPALGLFFGVLLVMGVYNLILFVSLREVSYLLYVGYVFFMGWWIAALLGLVYQHVWPQSPELNHRTLIGFSFSSVTCALFFARRFLETPRHAPRLDKAMLGLAAVLVADIVLTAVGAVDLLTTNRLASPLALLWIALLLAAGGVAARHKVPTARFFLLSFGVYAVGVFVWTAYRQGLLTPYHHGIHAFQFALAAGAIFLALGLADKINLLNRELQASAAALEAKNRALEELDRLKDAFLANTSHELRTPIHGIMGLAESLMDGAAGALNSAVRRNLAMIVGSGRRLTNLVNDILDFSKLKHRDLQLNRGAVDMRALADVVLAMSAPLVGDKPLALRNQVPEDLPAVDGDEDRLAQVMHNLVGNAIKFSEAGEVVITANADAQDVRLTVSDQGEGIAPELQQRIFESFEQGDGSTTRTQGGTGLGLAVTQQLVQLHGGSIAVQSSKGEGSSFTVTLPRAAAGLAPAQAAHRGPGLLQMLARADDAADHLAEREQAEDGPAEDAPTPGVDQRARILVVDDEPVNRQVLDNMLSSAGFEVLQAPDGARALAIVEQTCAPDLLLLDIMMPRMSGFEVCARLRETHTSAELPIIMLTAKNRVSDLVHGLTAGANDYLTKPFAKDELLARVRTHLRLCGMARAYARFVPHEFLQFLGHESILDVRLGDQVQREMTVLFSDIRSFTTLSERMSPKENFDFINRYLQQVGPHIRLHNGFIDKYIGDAVMALFPDSPEDGVRAAIAMHEAVRVLNAQAQVGGSALPDVHIGVGVHTGTLMLGTIGEHKRMEETVISDAVNLAARLEGLTKTFGAAIVVSDHTLKQMGDREGISTRFLGRVQVKGKQQAVGIHEVLDGDVAASRALKVETLPDFSAGIEHYLAGRLPEASRRLEAVLRVNGDDIVARHYLDLASHHMAEGIDETWTGVIGMSHK